MSIVIKLNSVDISSSIDWKSFEWKQVLTKEVCQVKFSIKNYGTKPTVVVGDTIEVLETLSLRFGGTVTDIENIVDGGVLIETKITVNDWSFSLNSKLVAKNYTSSDPATIITDIISTFTDGTFTTTNVETAGFDITSIRFNYEQVTSAIEKLAKMIGWEWYVDASKDVHFFPRSTVVDAPFDIDDTSGKLEWNTLMVNQNIQNMKNSIFVIGGTYLKTFTDLTTPDVYLTDGTKSVFPIAYAYDPSTIVVTLAGVAQTVGTDQVTPDGSVQVQYNETGRFIRFVSIPTTAQTVKVYGNAQIPIVANVSNEAAITAYGEIQDVIIDNQIKSYAEAQERGNAQIGEYGSPVNAVTFSTLETGLQIGQTIRINSTKFAVDINVIVKRFIARLYSPTQLRYEVECVGTDTVTFVDIMKLLLLQANADQVVDDNTVLQVLKLLDEEVSLADTLSAPTTSSPPYKYGPTLNTIGVWNFSTYS